MVVDNNRETWRYVHLSKMYMVSSLGRVASLARGKIKIRKIVVNENGYGVVNLYINKKYKMCKVHRLVAIAFIENPENKRTVNHIDGIKLNNQMSNLEWNTHSENIRHAFDNGIRKATIRLGELANSSKYKESDILFIRDVYASGAMNQYEIADLFGAKQGYINLIIKRKRWNHI